jgi:hypothetical protein
VLGSASLSSRSMTCSQSICMGPAWEPSGAMQLGGFKVCGRGSSHGTLALRLAPRRTCLNGTMLFTTAGSRYCAVSTIPTCTAHGPAAPGSRGRAALPESSMRGTGRQAVVVQTRGASSVSQAATAGAAAQSFRQGCGSLIRTVSMTTSSTPRRACMQHGATKCTPAWLGSHPRWCGCRHR